MALNAPRAWLVAYDITEPRRLLRLHRFLKKRAVPVQYSVFYFEGSAGQVGRLVEQIESHIDTDSDDVRVYQLPDHPDCIVLGRGSLPQQGLLISDRNDALAKLVAPAGDAC